MNLKKLGKLAQLPSWLNWILSVVEPLVVLAITFLISYFAYWLIFGSEQGERQERLIRVLKEINDNWKVGLLLLVLLFYRTIRMFLEQAEEAWGVKKRPLRGEPEEAANPPKKP